VTRPLDKARFPIPHSRLNRSLSFQLLLSQLLKVHRVTRNLEKVLAYQRQSFKKIREFLSQLGGADTNWRERPSWNIGVGALEKLRDHAHFLMNDKKLDQSLTTKLFEHASKTVLACQKCWDELHDTNVLSQEHHQKTAQHILRLSRTIKDLFPSFQNDENVIFYLLQHSEEFDEIYGPHFIATLLKKIYGDDLSIAKQTIAKKFTKRNFDQLPFMISKKVEELEEKNRDRSSK